MKRRSISDEQRESLMSHLQKTDFLIDPGYNKIANIFGGTEIFFIDSSDYNLKEVFSDLKNTQKVIFGGERCFFRNELVPFINSTKTVNLGKIWIEKKYNSESVTHPNNEFIRTNDSIFLRADMDENGFFQVLNKEQALSLVCMLILKEEKGCVYPWTMGLSRHARNFVHFVEGGITRCLMIKFNEEKKGWKIEYYLPIGD